MQTWRPKNIDPQTPNLATLHPHIALPHTMQLTVATPHLNLALRLCLTTSYPFLLPLVLYMLLFIVNKEMSYVLADQ